MGYEGAEISIALCCISSPMFHSLISPVFVIPYVWLYVPWTRP